METDLAFNRRPLFRRPWLNYRNCWELRSFVYGDRPSFQKALFINLNGGWELRSFIYGDRRVMYGTEQYQSFV